ncbi:hypothetical protein Pmar_PMAR008189 [Perkinsus marinus ATCC 50983]|uniref:Trafficking protein particle complex subunit n=1 Tax=Perkinsus marinus (strain ATCC 50983 / TXsc) TaxID=423536 RepID=C5LNH2_PERM5|nr:hypothetical protein Pmar_PMAR008189 [Perkinsus marinus ATCC 50983]EER01723.1 hypothetical protein Pmar_PMAR008189 [Perkinsus marinus ATCC 50983]|eukprot:XP_002769005.1 hypothetical protein Pmar_PMAR008189 [Perkinsus marinus ATCC 50983]
MKSFGQAMSPLKAGAGPEGFNTFSTPEYKVHHCESRTGYMFIMTTDPTVEDMQDVMAAIYTDFFVELAVMNPMYEIGGGDYWQQQHQPATEPRPYAHQRWGNDQYSMSGKGSGGWGWQQQQKGGYRKGGYKGKGGGKRWNDVDSMRDLPIERFVQEDMVVDPWASLYPKLKEEHPELYEKYAKYLDDQQLAAVDSHTVK